MGTTDAQPRYSFSENGVLRYVVPYEYVYQATTKGRWHGRQLLEVLTAEFKAFDRLYFTEAIKDGRIFLNNTQVTDPSCRIKPNQVLKHRCLHVHEPPILNWIIRVLYVDDHYFIVSKPPSMPVHPGGAYRYNTLLSLLLYDFDRATDMSDTCVRVKQSDVKPKHLSPLHRLDKFTSGVCVFGRDVSASRSFERLMRTRRVKKAYVCRVKGCIDDLVKSTPAGVVSLEAPVDDGGPPVVGVRCTGLVRCLDKRIGVYKFEADIASSAAGEKDGNLDDEALAGLLSAGNRSVTDFYFVRYNDRLNESLCLCRPWTGRTHQIRTQLEYLGTPISNDRCYGGTEDSPGSSEKSQFFPRISHVDIDTGYSKKDEDACGTVDAVLRRSAEQGTSQHHHSSGIFLHAYKYVFGELTVQDKAPEWVMAFETPGKIGVAAQLSVLADQILG